MRDSQMAYAIQKIQRIIARKSLLTAGVISPMVVFKIP